MATRAAATQARFVSGSATDLFHGSRFSTDRRCKTLGDVLLHLNARREDAMQRIEGISSIGQLDQAGSVAADFAPGLQKMNSVSGNGSIIQPDRSFRVRPQDR